MYTYILSTDANDTAYAAAREGLNEWVNTVNKKMNFMGASIVSSAVEVSSPLEPGWSSSKQTKRNYGTFGKIKLHPKWYWDSIEQNSYQDQFYATSEITMTPGTVTQGSTYKNHKFTLTIDPGYSDLSGNAPHLPGTVTTPSCSDRHCQQRAVGNMHNHYIPFDRTPLVNPDS